MKAETDYGSYPYDDMPPEDLIRGGQKVKKVKPKVHKRPTPPVEDDFLF
jgi:hypothetical protein